jgi:hypothetical protein
MQHRLITLALMTAAATGLTWEASRYWPRTLPLPIGSSFSTAHWRLAAGRPVVEIPGRYCVGEVASYDDELFAYLMTHHFRRDPALADAEVLLTFRNRAGSLRYTVRARIENDLLRAPYTLFRAADGSIRKEPGCTAVPRQTLDKYRHQNRVLLAAYNLPVDRRFEALSKTELRAYLRSFVRFKSATDPRTRSKIEAAPRALNSEEAGHLAADMIAVTDFYDLPLDLFLGIGAMENNYLNVPGDLRHAVWKRRADKGDIVLKRAPGRVRVLNPSAGVWQITRETLRYSRRLYLNDTRDYTPLPKHLRPGREFDPDRVPPELLTTYAGLLFRNLLDRSGGDVAKAVGAYNGGLGRPNARYAQGVRTVAEYARRVAETAAARETPGYLNTRTPVS